MVSQGLKEIWNALTDKGDNSIGNEVKWTDWFHVFQSTYRSFPWIVIEYKLVWKYLNEDKDVSNEDKPYSSILAKQTP